MKDNADPTDRECREMIKSSRQQYSCMTGDHTSHRSPGAASRCFKTADDASLVSSLVAAVGVREAAVELDMDADAVRVLARRGASMRSWND